MGLTGLTEGVRVFVVHLKTKRASLSLVYSEKIGTLPRIEMLFKCNLSCVSRRAGEDRQQDKSNSD